MDLFREMIRNLCRVFLIMWAVSIIDGDVWADDFTRQAVKPVEETIDIRQAMQKQEDQWMAEKQKLAAEYETLLARIEEETEAVDRLVQELGIHTRSRDTLKHKLAEIEKISATIAPYVQQVSQQLRDHISESPPFLEKERAARMAKLDRMMADSDIKMSEKFRRLTEALMVEAEYGSTIEVYPEDILLEGQTVQMRIFRLGRLSLFCQSLDKQTTGYYAVAEEKWQKLPEKFNAHIDAAMEMGAKRRPVELVTLPLGRLAAP